MRKNQNKLGECNDKAYGNNTVIPFRSDRGQGHCKLITKFSVAYIEQRPSNSTHLSVIFPTSSEFPQRAHCMLSMETERVTPEHYMSLLKEGKWCSRLQMRKVGVLSS